MFAYWNIHAVLITLWLFENSRTYSQVPSGYVMYMYILYNYVKIINKYRLYFAGVKKCTPISKSETKLIFGHGTSTRKFLTTKSLATGFK